MKLRRYPFDPVLQASNFCCAYCGRDLLANLDDFICLVRDHFIPHSAGGSNGVENRVASCAVCDRLKRDAVVADLAEAQELIAYQRDCHAKWYHFVVGEVR